MIGGNCAVGRCGGPLAATLGKLAGGGDSIGMPSSGCGIVIGRRLSFVSNVGTAKLVNGGANFCPPILREKTSCMLGNADVCSLDSVIALVGVMLVEYGELRGGSPLRYDCICGVTWSCGRGASTALQLLVLLHSTASFLMTMPGGLVSSAGSVVDTFVMR